MIDNKKRTLSYAQKWLMAIHFSCVEEQFHFLKSNFSYLLSFVLLLFLFIVNKPKLFLIIYEC